MCTGAARLNDRCTGHGCFSSRINVAASNDVFVNDRGSHRQGDAWKTHRCFLSSHAGVLAKGSPTVFVNDKQMGRIGDSVSCGSRVMTGSSDVFVGP